MTLSPYVYAHHAASARNHAAVVLDQDFSNTARGLYVGTGGNVSVNDAYGTAVIYKNVPDGTILPIQCSRVNSTGTTATDLVVWY